MDIDTATATLGALAQPTRLAVFRALVAAGAEGLPAGEIAGRLGVVQNTMSAHLATLARAGLIRGERRGREIRYTADMAAMSALLGFLMEDCCGGRPDLCRPALEAIHCEAE